MGTHNVTLTKSGSVHLTITDGAVSADSTTFVVNAGALNHFGFATIASPKTAGTPFSITLTAYDAHNNVVTAADLGGVGSTAVIFTTNHGGGSSATVSTAPVTFGAFASGVYIGSITVNHASSSPVSGLSITATAGSVTGTSNTFRLNPGPVPPAVHLHFLRLVDGIAITPTIAGIGDRTITATQGPTTTTNASGNFTVTGGVTKFAVTMSGGTTPLSTVAKTAGTLFYVRVTAQDAGGATVPNYTGMVALTSNAFVGTVNPTITTGGLVGDIGITPTIAGTGRTVTAIQGSIGTTDPSGPFTVVAGAPRSFRSCCQAKRQIPAL